MLLWLQSTDHNPIKHGKYDLTFSIINVLRIKHKFTKNIPDSKQHRHIAYVNLWLDLFVRHSIQVHIKFSITLMVAVLQAHREKRLRGQPT